MEERRATVFLFVGEFGCTVEVFLVLFFFFFFFSMHSGGVYVFFFSFSFVIDDFLLDFLRDTLST